MFFIVSHCSSSILNFPGKLWKLTGKFPRFPTDQFLFHQGMPARRSTKATCCTAAFCTVHAGSTTRCCHTCEKALLDVLGEEGNRDPSFDGGNGDFVPPKMGISPRKWWLITKNIMLTMEKWRFHEFWTVKFIVAWCVSSVAWLKVRSTRVYAWQL